MIKYWIKNRFAFDLTISILLSLLFCFAFIFPSNAKYTNLYDDNSLYINSEIDFQIPNPSVSQLKEIEAESFIEDTFGYYLTKTNVSGKKTAKVNFLMSDSMDNMSFTMFNEKTIISSSLNTANYAYLDRVASDSLGVSNGDVISVNIASNKIEFVVCRIYESNTLFKDGTVLVEFTGSIKDAYEANASSNSYSAAFIKASNDSKCENYLKTYIPLGRLKDRSKFDSDEAYNTYNDAIMSGNYANEITNFAENRTTAEKEVESAKTQLIIMSIIGAAVVGILYLITSEALRIRKSENKYFGELKRDKGSIKVYRLCSTVLSVAVYLIADVAVINLLKISNLILLTSIITIVLFTVALLVNLAQDKKYSKVGKN